MCLFDGPEAISSPRGLNLCFVYEVISHLHWLDQFSPLPPPKSPAALADEPLTTAEDVSSLARMGEAYLAFEHKRGIHSVRLVVLKEI